jgi:CubicO group peptidase (beta-lactamase class C family)
VVALSRWGTTISTRSAVRSFTAVILFALALSGCTPPPATAAPPTALAAPLTAEPTADAGTSAVLSTPDVDAWLDGAVPNALHREGIAGAVVSVVHDGVTVSQRGYGWADTGVSGDAAVPVDAASTLFRIGSISKLVTATAVMQLVEAGTLDLDRPVADYLDVDLATSFDTPVTLRHLLTHTAGFEDVIAGVIGDPNAPAPTLRDAVATDPPEQIYDPGTVPSYSNYSNALAGYIVQRASGRDFADYVAENVFAPAGMTSATLDQPLAAADAPAMSKGYDWAGSAEVPFEMVGPAPAGAISATAGDMSAFMLAQLGHPAAGTELLSAASLESMHSPALTADTLGGLAAGPRMGLSFFEQNRNGHRILGHAGDLTAFHAELQIYPDDDTGIYIALNSTGVRADSSTAIREQLLNGFTDRYFPDDTAASTSQPTAAEHAQSIAGSYLVSRRSESTFARLFFLLSSVELAADPAGTLTVSAIVDPAGSPVHFTEVEPWVWQEVDGSRRLAVDQVDGAARAIGLNAAFTLLPLPAYQGVLLPVAAFSVATLFGGLLLRPVRALVRWRYRSPAIRSRRQRLLGTLRVVAQSALVIAAVLWAIVANALLSDAPPPADLVLRAAQLFTLLGVGGVVPSAWSTVTAVAAAARARDVRAWLAAAGLVVLTAGFIGLGYLSIVGGLWSPSLSY